jgi:hypothetical protein
VPIAQADEALPYVFGRTNGRKNKR